MSLSSEEAAKVRLELRAAEQARDAYRRELAGEDPVMLPDFGTAADRWRQPSEYRRAHRRATQAARRVAAPIYRPTPRCCGNPQTDRASWRSKRSRKSEARRKATPHSRAAKLSASTNPVFQRIKISLAEAEANVASLRCACAKPTAPCAVARGREQGAGDRSRSGTIESRLRRDEKKL